MEGLAKGIEKSKGLVADAVEGVAGDMVINPNVSAEMTGSTSQMAAGQSASLSGLTTAITDAISQMSGDRGDIVIPVYLGGTMLDEVIINAQQRANLRSGGR
jgi:hypothetical protein